MSAYFLAGAFAAFAGLCFLLRSGAPRAQAFAAGGLVLALLIGDFVLRAARGGFQPAADSERQAKGKEAE